MRRLILIFGLVLPLQAQSPALLASFAGPNTVATPTTSNVGGSCTGSDGAGWTCTGTTTVTFASGTSGATFCSRTDGTPPAATTPPTCDAGSTNANGISTASTATYKVLGSKTGMTNSAVATVTYTISGGGITIVSNVLGTAGSGTVSLNTGGANGLYVWETAGGGGVGSDTLVDSNLNTWTQLRIPGGVVNAAVWYVNAVPTVGTGQTFTISCGFCAWGVVAVSGMKTSSSSDGNLASSSASSSTIQTPLINPGSGNHIVFLVLFDAANTAGSWNSVDSGYTILQHRVFSGGINYDGALTYLIQSPGAGTQPTATFSTSGLLQTHILSFAGI